MVTDAAAALLSTSTLDDRSLYVVVGKQFVVAQPDFAFWLNETSWRF